jgi:Domain of Unknown Function (DUF1080)
MLKHWTLSLLLIFVATFTNAQKKARTAEIAPQWTMLFDGKTMNGWKKLGGEAAYVVENGAIVGTTVPNTPNTFLTTEATYSDFIFECEVSVENGMNSGIQFRSLSKPEYQNGRVHGYQFELDASPRNFTGGLYDEARKGWLYTPEINPASRTAFKFNGAWNMCRIEAIGTTLRTFVNGIEVAHLIDDQTASGFFCLQVHSISKEQQPGQKVKWRNLRIQTGAAMRPTPVNANIRVVNTIPNQVSDIEKQQGYTLLWDGKTTNGWRGAYKTTFPAKGWEIADGELRVLKTNGAESANGGDIITTSNYGAFELSFEFKLTPGANSGIKYFVREWLQYTHEFKPGQPLTVPEEFIKTGSAIGLEYQVLDDALHPDAKLGAGGNRTLASLYDLIPADKTGYRARAVKGIGEWNIARIVVYPDNRVEHFLNGFKMLEYQRLSPLFNSVVERSKYAVWGKQFGAAAEGPILIQDHGDAVSYRSIKIRRL